jgi:hypothetical protein
MGFHGKLNLEKLLFFIHSLSGEFNQEKYGKTGDIFGWIYTSDTEYWLI